MGKVAHIYLVGPVGIFEDENTGETSGFTIDSVISQVQAFKGQDVERYNFKMKGPGGYVEEGNAIFDYMRSLRKDGIQISTEQIGDIGSIMTKIFLAADPEHGERRLVNKKFKFMIHNPWGQVVGNSQEMENYTEELKAVENELRNFYVKETGITAEGLKPLMDKEMEMTAEQAVSLGFATGYTEEAIEAKVLAKIKPNKSKEMSETKTESYFKEILNKIKALGEPKQETEPTAMDLTLEGGSTLRLDTEDEEGLIGSSAMLVDADGNESPAPEGEHTLSDGRIITIAADGTVSDLREGEEEMPSEEMAALKAEIEKLRNENSELKDSFNEKVESAVEAKLKEINSAVDKLTVEKEEVSALKEQMKAMKTLYNIKSDVDFVGTLKEKNTPTSFEEAKARLEEIRANKKTFKRGNITGKV